MMELMDIPPQVSWFAYLFIICCMGFYFLVALGIAVGAGKILKKWRPKPRALPPHNLPNLGAEDKRPVMLNNIDVNIENPSDDVDPDDDDAV